MSTADSTRVRTFLARGLGVLWIIGGLLQLQPGFFSPGVMTNVLVPLIERQPAWFRAVLLAGDRVWSQHLSWSNPLLAAIEIGVGLLVVGWTDRRVGRLGLWVSLGLSVVLWCFTEGFGGVLTGYASMIYQFPGTAFIYGLLALLLLLDNPWRLDVPLRRLLGIGLGLMWLMGAVLQALPAAGFWGAERLGGLFGDVTMVGMEPPAVARLTNAAVTVSVLHPAAVNAVLVVVMALLGIAWLARPQTRAVAWATGIWLALMWVIPEEVGTLFTGYAMNPGMAVVLALVVTAAMRPSPATAPPSPGRS